MNIHCRYDELVHISSLKPFDKNRNRHEPEQIIRLAKLLREHGVRAPVVLANPPFDCVAKGHGTIEAFKENGWDKVPVVRQDFESREQLYAYVQSDNAITADQWGGGLDLAGINADLGDLGPDFDVELLGIKDFTVDVSERYNEATEDEVSATPIEPKTRLGELWILGSHRLLCGDSTDRAQVDRLMKGEKADMVFTDPPYGDCNLLDKTGKYIYRNDKDGRKNQIYSGYQGEGEFTFPDIHEVISSIADKQIVWGGNALPLPISRSWIIWDKTVSDEGGNWFSDCELAWCNLDTPIFKIKHIFQGAHKEGEKEERVHPTQKPVGMIIKTLTRIEEKKGNRKFKTDFLVDLFLGSGSTLIACEKTNRRCFGMEIDPHYCDVVLDRWAKYTGKEPIREDGTPWSYVKDGGD